MHGYDALLTNKEVNPLGRPAALFHFTRNAKRFYARKGKVLDVNELTRFRFLVNLSSAVFSGTPYFYFLI